MRSRIRPVFAISCVQSLEVSESARKDQIFCVKSYTPAAFFCPVMRIVEKFNACYEAILKVQKPPSIDFIPSLPTRNSSHQHEIYDVSIQHSIISPRDFL